VIMLVIVLVSIPASTSRTLFWSFHPLHVLFSAMVTAGMYRLHNKGSIWKTIIIGYLGSIGIATLSDSIIPFWGESLINLPNRGLHFGFIEKWWLVNPLAFTGVFIGSVWPSTKIPHAIHVLLSTWASLFHMTMALGKNIPILSLSLIPVFLFLAVWIPCCTSDIAFPLFFTKTVGKRKQLSVR